MSTQRSTGWICALALAALAMPLSAAAQDPGPDAVLHTPAPAPGSVTVAPPAPYTPAPGDQDRSDQAKAPSEAAPDSTGDDADSPDGVAGYYRGKGFQIKSRDGNNMLRVGLQAGYRFAPLWNEGKAQSRNSFFVLRPIIAGNIFREWIRFWTSFEFAGNPPYLLDSFVEIQPWDEFGLRIGQQYTPLSRHEYAGPQQLLFPDWSPVANYFWPGRDKGITAMGTVLDGKLDYWAGVYSGSPLKQFTTFTGTWVTIGRVSVNPMGPVASDEAPYITSDEPVPFRVSYTLQGAAGDYAQTSASTNPGSFDVEDSGDRRKTQMGSADFWLQGPRYVMLVEGYLRRSEFQGMRAYRSAGIWGQAGYMVLDRLLDVGGRFSWLNTSNKLVDDKGYALEAQVGYYPLRSTELVLRGRYGYGHQATPGDNALGSATLLLPPGKSHLLTIQLMLAI